MAVNQSTNLNVGKNNHIEIPIQYNSTVYTSRKKRQIRTKWFVDI